jgi:hydrogenase maturation protease
MERKTHHESCWNGHGLGAGGGSSWRRIRRDSFGAGHPALPQSAPDVTHVLPPGRTGVDVPQRGARILVAGVGNMFLRDDGFGPEVARRLASGGNPNAGADPAADPDAGPSVDAVGQGVKVVDYGIRGMHLAYDLLAGVDVLVLVDAVPPAGGEDPAPGSIRVLRVRSGDLDSSASFDPHGMDPVAVLGRLRSLGGELPVTYVVGCVPADLGEGIGLSAPVAAAVPEALAAVGELLAQFASVNP